MMMDQKDDSEAAVLQELIQLMSKLNGEKLDSAKVEIKSAGDPLEEGQEELSIEPLDGDLPSKDPKEEMVAQMEKALSQDDGDNPTGDDEDEMEGDSYLRKKGKLF